MSESHDAPGGPEQYPQRTDCAPLPGRPTTVAGAPVREGPPVVSLGLIALNVVIFLVTAVQAGSVVDNDSAELMYSWVLNPFYVVYDDQWYRLLTSGFLHFGPLHILANMISLYIIGREVEVVLGRARFVVLYVLSLLGGSVAALLFSDVRTGTAGASGAVFGLMGALAVAVVRLKLDPKPVLFIIIVNMFISFRVSGISWQAHLGGLVIGSLLMVAMVYGRAADRKRIQSAAVLVLLAVLSVLFFLRRSMILDMVTA